MPRDQIQNQTLEKKLRKYYNLTLGIFFIYILHKYTSAFNNYLYFFKQRKIMNIKIMFLIMTILFKIPTMTELLHGTTFWQPLKLLCPKKMLRKIHVSKY